MKLKQIAIRIRPEIDLAVEQFCKREGMIKRVCVEFALIHYLNTMGRYDRNPKKR